MDISCTQRIFLARTASTRCACNSLAIPAIVSVRSASSVACQLAPTAAQCLNSPLRPRRRRQRSLTLSAQPDDLEVPQDNKTRSCDLTVNIDGGPLEQKHSAEHMEHMRDFCRVLIKYVNEVDPSVVDSFEHSGPPQVVDAMQAAVIGLCGHLPPQFFEINVVTLGENLRMLMHSFMSTGYLYRHIADHLDMQAGVDRALPSGVLQDDLEQDLAPGRSYGWRSQNWDGYAKGSNTTDVSGKVVRWSHDTGVAKLDASQYIEMLEREVEILRQELDDSNEALEVEESGMGTNEVLQYMRTHGQSQAAQIRPGPEVREAMGVFLQRLLGTDSNKELASMVSETSMKELSRLLLWVMIVGYTLRSMEVRFSMGRAYALPYVALEDKGSRDNFDKL